MKTYQYLLLLATLVGCARAEGISEQDQIYVVAGVLGGVCLLLTIATVYNSISNIRLEAKVAMLQNAGTVAAGAATAAISDLNRQNTDRREMYPPNPSARDEYRGPPPPRDNIRMARMAPQPPARRDQYY